MEESNLDQCIHEVNMRIRWLKNLTLSCPHCGYRLRLVGISMFARWICNRCNKFSRIEPLKNATLKKVSDNY